MTDAVPFAPRLSARALEFFEAAAADLASRALGEVGVVARELWVPRGRGLAEATEVAASLLLLSDLLEQGWDATLALSGEVFLRQPGVEQQASAERARIRRQEQLKRQEQLLKPSVRRFLQGMYRPRVVEGRFRSVEHLMRDGRDLAASLEAGGEACPVRPYVQPVVAKQRCVHTGLKLMDVWRHFRYTWSNQYTSVPGRSMCFLVRDAAAPCHPVMGIFALSSAVVQIRSRDLFLGWHPDIVLERLARDGDPALLRVLLDVIEGDLDYIFLDDLLAEGLVSTAQLAAPSPALVSMLREAADEARAQHRQSPDLSLKRSSAGADDRFWQARAQSCLFLSKRLKQLAELLDARLVLAEVGTGSLSPDEVRRVARDRRGKRVLRRLVRRLKSRRVGISLADLTVCGAVPPYSHILGGKLVAMLAASPATVAAYRAHYAGAVSEIASALAGRAVTKPPELAFIGTTSLYGVKPNQYTRVVLPAARTGDPRVRYRELGHSESFGSSHYRRDTLQALAAVASRKSGVIEVNNVFGEGTSPKLRQLRTGLDALGLRTDVFLQHGRKRVVYGVELASNVQNFLLGLDQELDYLMPLDDPDRATAVVADHWWERWARKRATQPERLDRVRAEVLSRPLRHGASVQLPSAGAQQQLFGDT